jgi:hypothetical protein
MLGLIREGPLLPDSVGLNANQRHGPGPWRLAHCGVVSAGPLPLSRGANPAGGVLTTARDVGNYFIALLNGGVFEGRAGNSVGGLPVRGRGPR